MGPMRLAPYQAGLPGFQRIATISLPAGTTLAEVRGAEIAREGSAGSGAADVENALSRLAYSC
jgi:hypothetical protein